MEIWPIGYAVWPEEKRLDRACRQGLPPFGRLLMALAIVAMAATATVENAVAQAGLDRTAAARPDEIETDRDSFTFAPTTAGAQRTILEASYSFIDNRLGPEAHSVPELLVRRGLGDKVELRVGFNYEAGGPGTVSGNEIGGEDVISEYESRVLYGTKIETSEQAGWIPQSALVVQGYTPTYGPTTQSTLMAGEAFGWRFANGWEWNSAMRYGTGFVEEDAFNQWAPSSVLKIPLSERWNVHTEYFGIFSSGKELPLNIQYISFGGHVLVTKDLELGLRYGWGLNESTPNFFTNLGVGARY
jgi:Putative MetA-pathway of phenol degradation